MIDIEVPGAPPLLLNARLHWRSLQEKKSKWYEWTAMAVAAQVPPEPFERACVRYSRYCGFREPDYDNLVSGFKWIQDGLVRAGVLRGDEVRHLETHYEWHPASPKEKRVHIQIVPVLSGAGE
jgi:hypothetical protein